MREERQDFSRLNSANFNAFHAAALAAEDSNSGFPRFQKGGEVFTDDFVGAIFDGGRLDSDFERAVNDACDFIAAGARLDADLKDDTAVSRNDVELLAAAGGGGVCGVGIA